jgi:hypothetical protein
MAFEKGVRQPGCGRPKGGKNKINNDIRQVFLKIFADMGDDTINEKTGLPMTGHEAMLTWARTSPTEFYRLYAKMIPTTAPVEDDGHEDFIDELVFEDEQPRRIEAVDVTNETIAKPADVVAKPAKPKELPNVGQESCDGMQSGGKYPRLAHDYAPPIESNITPP